MSTHARRSHVSSIDKLDCPLFFIRLSSHLACLPDPLASAPMLMARTLLFPTSTPAAVRKHPHLLSPPSIATRAPLCLLNFPQPRSDWPRWRNDQQATDRIAMSHSNCAGRRAARPAVQIDRHTGSARVSSSSSPVSPPRHPSFGICSNPVSNIFCPAPLARSPCACLSLCRKAKKLIEEVLAQYMQPPPPTGHGGEDNHAEGDQPRPPTDEAMETLPIPTDKVRTGCRPPYWTRNRCPASMALFTHVVVQHVFSRRSLPGRLSHG